MLPGSIVIGSEHSLRCKVQKVENMTFFELFGSNFSNLYTLDRPKKRWPPTSSPPPYLLAAPLLFVGRHFFPKKFFFDFFQKTHWIAKFYSFRLKKYKKSIFWAKKTFPYMILGLNFQPSSNPGSAGPSDRRFSRLKTSPKNRSIMLRSSCKKNHDEFLFDLSPPTICFSTRP